MAESEAAEIEARITGLQSERADLTEAIARLRRGIATLDHEMPRRAAGPSECLAALVGRDGEIELLLQRWARAKEGEGQIVTDLGRARHRQVAYHRGIARAAYGARFRASGGMSQERRLCCTTLIERWLMRRMGQSRQSRD
jgi:hypothetical protein